MSTNLISSEKLLNLKKRKPMTDRKSFFLGGKFGTHISINIAF